MWKTGPALPEASDEKSCHQWCHVGYHLSPDRMWWQGISLLWRSFQKPCVTMRKHETNPAWLKNYFTLLFFSYICWFVHTVLDSVSRSAFLVNLKALLCFPFYRCVIHSLYISNQTHMLLAFFESKVRTVPSTKTRIGPQDAFSPTWLCHDKMRTLEIVHFFLSYLHCWALLLRGF